MARPQKKTLEFFLHDASARQDPKIRVLERKHGNDGYATYFKLLEMCCEQEGMLLNLSKPVQLEVTVLECGLRDEAHFYAIVQHCVDIELFDRQMWESERIVFSHGLYQRYLRRLEDRRQSAARKKRSDEVKKLTQKIRDVTRSNPIKTSSHAVVTRENSPELSEPTEPTELPEVIENYSVGLIDSEIAGAIADSDSALNSDGLTGENPTPDQYGSESPEEGGSVPVSSKKRKKAVKLEDLRAEEVYEYLADRPKFERFWERYCKRCNARIKPDGKRYNPGSKKQAAIAWINTLELGGNMDRFWEGCKAFDWDSAAIPHAAVFIRGSKTDGRQPYWEAALEQQAAIAMPSDSGSLALLSESEAAPLDLIDSLMGANAETHPWCGDRRILEGFLEYLTNTMDSRIPIDNRRQMAIAVVRKANAAAARSVDYLKAFQPWMLFLNGAAKAQTPEQATRADRMSPALRELCNRREAAILKRLEESQNAEQRTI